MYNEGHIMRAMLIGTAGTKVDPSLGLVSGLQFGVGLQV